MAEDIDDVLLEAEDHMEKSIVAFEQELATVRTGRASPALIEHVEVDYHGTATQLKQLAMIRTPEARLLVIEPWEKNIIRAIEKGLSDANLGLNPQSDGKVIRIAIPPLTEERRKDMVKTCQKMAEGSRVAVRNVRRDANDSLRKMEKNSEIGEDDRHRGEAEIQKLTDQAIEKIDKLLAGKEQELLED